MDKIQIKSNLKDRTRYTIVFIALVIAFIIISIMSINSGSVDISISDLYKIIVKRVVTSSTDFNIVWKIRLPRILTAAVLGGALSISGFLLQTFFRNPIAGPFVLGISSGARMVVAFVMIIYLKYFGAVSHFAMIGGAFAGSLLAMGFVLLMSRQLKSMPMLLVAGIMIGYIASAITNLFVAFANEYQITHLYTWGLGTFSGAAWDTLGFSAVIVFITTSIVFLISKPIGAYLLGEAYAQSLGVNIRFFRVLLILLSSILSACVTAFAGPISFVGIAVPHITKMLLNTAKPIVVIPAAFIGGSTFCMLCDLIARTAFAPTELSISTVTAIFGAPIVIYLMLKKKKGITS